MKHIHFIGICGVAMSALALALHKKGYRVTGSDVGFYPPVSDMLKGTGVEFYAGWHPEKMLAPTESGGTPDLVIVGNVAASTNPEWLAVQAQKIPFKSYPEAIAEFWVKENSIVCAGTYGKTTTSALLAWILHEAGLAPSYMFGGLAAHDFPSAALSDSEWSVLEGDEYKSARWDNGPKFAHYRATHLLLTALSWDHVDVYSTEASYFKVFSELVHSLPPSGLLVACADDDKVFEIAKLANGEIVTYGRGEKVDYQFTELKESQNGLEFVIQHQGEKYSVTSPLLGAYQAQNITGAFALACEIGIEPKKITAALATFAGLKRRLEKRFVDGVTIFDDIAHSPAKARSVLENVRRIYIGRIIAVFEPNTGNRKPDALPLYAHAFAAADEVIIPRLTKVKTSADDLAPPIEGDELARAISTTYHTTHYIDDDAKLVHYIHTATQPGDVIIFLGSHGFRGMIESLIKSYENS